MKANICRACGEIIEFANHRYHWHPSPECQAVRRARKMRYLRRYYRENKARWYQMGWNKSAKDSDI